MCPILNIRMPSVLFTRIIIWMFNGAQLEKYRPLPTARHREQQQHRRPRRDMTLCTADCRTDPPPAPRLPMRPRSCARSLHLHCTRTSPSRLVLLVYYLPTRFYIPQFVNTERISHIYLLSLFISDPFIQ